MYLEEFCAWFQRQEAAIRLEMLVTMLQMLHPLELRFVGSCVEELARKDYFCLRDFEIRCNNGQLLSQLTDLSDSVCRSRFIIGLSLLYSGNYDTATLLYGILSNLKSALDHLPRIKGVLDEIILLLVMAKHHPAFNFDQKIEIVQLLQQFVTFANSAALGEYISSFSLKENSDRANDQLSDRTLQSKTTRDQATQAVEETNNRCCTCGGMERVPSGDFSLTGVQPIPIFIEAISVKGVTKNGDEDVYNLQVTWSNGKGTETSKTLNALYDFHKQLLDWHPTDAGACGSGRKLPYFPGYRGGSSGEPASSDSVTREVHEYIEDLVKLSPEILRSPCTIDFFKPHSLSEPDSAAGLHNALHVGGKDTLPIYDTHVSPHNCDARMDDLENLPSRPDLPTLIMHKSEKSDETSNTESQSSPTKSTEACNSRASTDLTRSVSMGSVVSGNDEHRVKRRTSLASRPFIPNPLYSVLHRAGLVNDYKRYLSPKTLEELWAMTDADIVHAGLPFEVCSKIINAAKRCGFELMAKQLNGTVLPMVNATQFIQGDMTLPMMHGRRRSTPPTVNFRTDNIAHDDLAISTPLIGFSGMTSSATDPLSVGTNLSPLITNPPSYVDFVNGPGITLLTPPSSDSIVTGTNPLLACPMEASAKDTCASSSSISWIQPSPQEERSVVARSYSADSNDTTTTTTYVLNFNTASSSLPPSQSQSPAPQIQPFFPVQPAMVVSTGGNRIYQHQPRPSSKPSYGVATPHYGYKTRFVHPTWQLQRLASTLESPQPQLYPLMPTPQQLTALPSAIPAASFVRAPPSNQHIRLSCQQCNGASSNCPFCSHVNTMY